LIGVEVSLTDSQDGGKDEKSRVRTKVIEEKYFERWLMMVNVKTVLVQESTTTHVTAPATSPTAADDDQTDMATRGSESNQVNEDRPPGMIFRRNKEDVNSSIYSSSSSSSSSSGGASSSNEFYSVISSTESFTSNSLYSSCSIVIQALRMVMIYQEDISTLTLLSLPKDNDDVSSCKKFMLQ